MRSGAFSLLLVWFVTSICRSVLGAPPPKVKDDTNEKPAGFPAPLDKDTFHQQLSSGLHIVEFFSPYCSHCKSLAPIWQETWLKFNDESNKLNIAFSQVDCVASGDLCAEQEIKFYPEIRLYSASGYIKSYPPQSPRTVEGLIEFARSEALNPENNPNAPEQTLSKELGSEEIVHYLDGDLLRPILISLWPTSQLVDLATNVKFEKCSNCQPFQKTWSALSRRLSVFDIDTGHVNCENEPELCSEFGFTELVSPHRSNGDRDPKVILILPDRKSNNLFYFSGPFTTDTAPFEDFARRYFSNSKPSEISIEELRSIATKNIALEDLENSRITEATYIVFAYDPETVVEEDFDILEYMIEPLGKMPNVHLRKIGQKLHNLSHDLFEEMYKIINLNSDQQPRTLSEEYFTMNTFAEYPTFFMIRESDRIPYVFEGYSTTEMRNLDTIMNWVNSIHKPMITELGGDSIEKLLNFKTDIYSHLLVQIVDTIDDAAKKTSLQSLNSLIVASYEYEDVRSRKMLEAINNKRAAKMDQVEAMKRKNKPSSTIIEKMRQEIPHNDDHKILLSYLNMEKYPKFLLSPKSTKSDLSVGDIIVVDKKNHDVYSRDLAGSKLKADSFSQVAQLLIALNFPERGTKRILSEGSLRSLTQRYCLSKSFLFVVGIFLVVLLSRISYTRRKFRSLLNLSYNGSPASSYGKDCEKAYQD